MCNLWVVWDCCIYQCQSDMCGVIIYSVTQIYVLKGYKPHSSPPIRFHSSSLSGRYTACVCVCVWVVCDWGSEYDERNVLSILSRGDVLKGTLLLINSWDPKEKGTFCGFAEIKRKKKKFFLLLVSILTDAACARSYVLGWETYYLWSAFLSIIHSSVRNTGGGINSSHLQHIPEQQHPIHVQKKTLITAARDSGGAAKLAKARGGEALWFSRAGMDSTQTRLSKRTARLWCIIQKQVMYGRCVLERFNKRESCLSFGGEYCVFPFLSFCFDYFNLQLTLQTTNNFCSLLLYWNLPSCRTRGGTYDICIHGERCPRIEDPTSEMLINSRGNCSVFICDMTKHLELDPWHML